MAASLQKASQLRKGPSSPNLEEGVSIRHESGVYTVTDILRYGNHGDVVQCRQDETGELLALKCIRKKYQQAAEKEAKILDCLRNLDSDGNNLVKFKGNFEYKDWNCLTFEKLDLTLLDFMARRDWKPLRVAEIRPIAQQMLSALSALKKAGITHTSIKPENIMITNQDSQPLRVKLISFGAACETSHLSVVDVPQTCGYTAPEVYLDLPLDSSMDMWGLGCTLAFLLFGKPIYPTDCEYTYMRYIIQQIGQPANYFLDKGRRVRRFFTREESIPEHIWRFKSPNDYEKTTGRMTGRRCYTYKDPMSDLQTNTSALEDPHEIRDLEVFADLLEKMFMVNPTERILPAQALKHTFITMKHLAHSRESPYVISAHEKMSTLINQVEFKRGATICDKSTVYHVEEVLGSGAFGTVAKCRKTGTDQVVALKVMAEEKAFSAEKELEAIECLRKFSPDKINIINCFDWFTYKDCYCFTFELLDESLLDFMIKRNLAPLRAAEIRPIAEQMFVALTALKSIGITHTDIKPDNIMLVNHQVTPFRVKLIDFGLCHRTCDLSAYHLFQAPSYRAPEVHLGLPPNEAVDVWGLGCTLAFLILGRHLYPYYSDYEIVQSIVELYGQPDDCLLDNGCRVDQFFTLEQTEPERVWRFKTPDEYKKATGAQMDKRDDTYFNLDSDIQEIASTIKDFHEAEDFEILLDLISRMQEVNPAHRILPSDALNHSFITMEHLPITSNKPYVTEACEIMYRCRPRTADGSSPDSENKNTTEPDPSLTPTTFDTQEESGEEKSESSFQQEEAAEHLTEEPCSVLNSKLETLTVMCDQNVGDIKEKCGPSTSSNKTLTNEGDFRQKDLTERLMKNNSQLVEVKPKKIWFRKIRKLFSKLFNIHHIVS